MSLTQSLLYAAQSDITIERIRDLVDQVGPENLTVEYKEQMSSSVLEGIAALANTYGGLLLVGVSDDREIKGVKEKTADAIADQCATKLEPPWAPPIIAIPLEPGSERYVMVIRVVPGQHPRPLLLGGRAPMRHHNTTHPADWQRLKELFAEADAAQRDDTWSIRAPEMPQDADGPDKTVDFIIRCGLEFPVSRDAKWRSLSEKTITALSDALEQSPLADAMVALALGDAPNGGSDRFQPRGFNRARNATLRWWCAPGGDWPPGRPKPVEACIRLQIPGSYGEANQALRVEIDVAVRKTAAYELPREQSRDVARQLSGPWRITTDELAQLVDGLLETLSTKTVIEQLAALAGVDPIAVPQPRVMHMVTTRPLAEVLDTTGLRQIPDAGPSHGAHLRADPARDLADARERQEQVTAWLTQIALDAGLSGMERKLQPSTVQ